MVSTFSAEYRLKVLTKIFDYNTLPYIFSQFVFRELDQSGYLAYGHAVCPAQLLRQGLARDGNNFPRATIFALPLPEGSPVNPAFSWPTPPQESSHPT